MSTDVHRVLETDAGVYRGVIRGLPLDTYKPEGVCPEPVTGERYEGANRGVLYLFSHRKYDGGHPEPRVGTLNDEIAAKRFFDSLGFRIEEYPDREFAEIITTLRNARVGKVECFAIMILTHGNLHKLYAKDGEYEEKLIYNALRENKTLKGILKWLTIQACRDESKTKVEKIPRTLLALPPDTIIVHSTYPDEVAIRDPKEGSYLIQILCRRLEKMQQENDLLDEMLFVKRDVGQMTFSYQMVVVAYNTTKAYVIRPPQINGE